MLQTDEIHKEPLINWEEGTMAKKLFSVFLAFVLVIGMIPVTEAGATEAPAAFSDMPNNWATKALENAVANGLLTGYDGKIMPDSPLTRAQMAAIITRAFGAVEEADISAYTDVKSGEWYAGYIAKAVKMGVMEGYDGKMYPESNITREQAFTVLARALKLDPVSVPNKSFEDASKVSDWAKGLVFAMINAGYIQGSNGRINPQADITRAEFAQVMYNIIGEYIKVPGIYTKVADGNIMVSVPGVTLKDLTINGDLIVGDGVGDGDLILENVTIKGRLVARGGGMNSIVIRGGSIEGKVVIAKVDGRIRVSVEGGAEVEVIVIDDGYDAVIIEGDVGTVEINVGDVPVSIRNATVDKVIVNCSGTGDITVEQGAKVSEILVSEQAEGTYIEVLGEVTNIETSAPNTRVSGSGSVKTVTANEGADGTSVTTPNTEVRNEGASGVTAGGGKEVPKNGSSTNNSSGSDIVTPPSGGGGGGYVPTPVTTRSTVTRDPGNTGGAGAIFDEESRTFSGTIAFYEAGADGNPPVCGNYIGVQITAPAGVTVDKTRATFTYTDASGNTTTLTGSEWLDGDNYVYYYPRVTDPGQVFTVVIDWDGSGRRYAPETITIKVAEEAVLEPEYTISDVTQDPGTTGGTGLEYVYSDGN